MSKAKQKVVNQKQPVGRPPKPIEDVHDIAIKVYVSQRELEQLRAAASVEERDLSSWLRIAGMRCARKGDE